MKTTETVAAAIQTLAEIADEKVGPKWAEKVAALRQMVLSLQEDNLRLQAEKAELFDAKRAAEQRALELERRQVEDDYWRELEHKYQLRPVANDFYARVGKRTEDPKEPVHCLCADCFRLRKEKLLQCVETRFDMEAGRHLRVLACNGCGARVTTEWPAP